MEKRKLSIIWNLTQQCSWNCTFCCVDAKYVKELRLVNEEKDIKYSSGDEMNYIKKCEVIEQLEKGKYTIDFSGGELFLDPLNLELILKASKILGPENIGISTSGAFITEETAKKLQNNVRDVELTLDCVPYKYYKFRPIGYHEFTANGIDILKSHGIHTGVQTVLTKENIDKDSLFELFKWIEMKQIDDWSLLKFFPAGRGAKYINHTPTHQEYCEVVDYIKEITKGSKVNVNFQYLLPNHEKYTLECRSLKKSIGILPNGNVISCFWALGDNMSTIDDKFHLGNIIENNMKEILQSAKAKYWIEGNHKCKFVEEANEEDCMQISG